MAREKDKKPRYEGKKLSGDTKEYREARAARALKNAQGERQTNEMFAVQDQTFKDACERANVKPTARQASKFRNKYGLAAHAAGLSSRKVPVAN